MKYGYKEVTSDSEAKRFARNLCKKKRERFPTFDDAMGFVFNIRKVVSDTEYARTRFKICSWTLQPAASIADWRT